MQTKFKRIFNKVGQYFDDLLLVCGGVCLTAGVYGYFGRPASLMAAGICLIAYAFIVARSQKGGR